MKHKLVLILIITAGLFLRLYHIEFGLPHSFHADEPEIVEPAIKYTYEIRSIVANNDYYKLIPISFVYGTFPTYINTVFTMFFSKVMNLMGFGFEKWHIYVFLRNLNALGSILVVWASYKLYKKMFEDSSGAIIVAFLASLSWIFIVHAHYVNADLIQTILLTLAYLTTYSYYKTTYDSKYTFLTGILLGLALGTKITTLITIPIFLLVWLWKRDWKGFLAVTLFTFAAFLVTNPFSFIFSDSFVFRIYTMFTKEAGMVFDSVDSNPFKYLLAAIFTTTPLVLLTSLYGKLSVLKKKEDFVFHLFLVGQVLIYIVFFSLQARRVDRWLLPILPIIFIYASYGLTELRFKINKHVFQIILALVVFSYLYYPTLLLKQFDRYTPKAQAYVWMQQNTDAHNLLVKTLAYTEEGLDPINKLPFADVTKVPVYTDESAQYFVPEDPTKHKYVILASKPMQYYKKPEIKKAFPVYVEKWEQFEQTILDESKFKLVKEFVLHKPNLVNLSDVFIYENLSSVGMLE